MTREEARALTPYAIEYTDGYYSVRQCRNVGHAHERAKEDRPDHTVKSVRQVQ